MGGKIYIWVELLQHVVSCCPLAPKWISNCCSYIIENNLLWRDDNNDDVCFILDQSALLYFYNANSLKQRSFGRYVVLLWCIIMILSQHTWMLRAWRRGSKYPFNNLWLDPTRSTILGTSTQIITPPMRLYIHQYKCDILHSLFWY